MTLHAVRVTLLLRPVASGRWRRAGYRVVRPWLGPAVSGQGCDNHEATRVQGCLQETALWAGVEEVVDDDGGAVSGLQAIGGCTRASSW